MYPVHINIYAYKQRKTINMTSTILPQGEALRRAVKWISAQLQQNANANKMQIVGEAVFRFNLSPKDAEFLYQLYSKKTE